MALEDSSKRPMENWLQPEQMGRTNRQWLDIHRGAGKHLPTVQMPPHLLHPVFHHSQSHSGISAEIVHRNHPHAVRNHGRYVGGPRVDARLTNAMDLPAKLMRMRGGTPWMTVNHKTVSGIDLLHREIEDFYVWISPTAAEKRMRQDLVNRIFKVITDKFPKCSVHCFGSYRTGLYLPLSDIDMVIFHWDERTAFHLVKDELAKAGVCPRDNIEVIARTAVPIIRLTDKETGIKVDISFNMANAVKSAQFIDDAVQRFPSLPKVVLVLKQFLYQRNLNEVYHGGISSYCLILMVISFFQHNPRIKYISEPNLGVLLIEFLELYGRRFNYLEVAIRVKDDGSYITKEQMVAAMPPGSTTSFLSIEDPLEPGNDVGQSSYGVPQVKKCFEIAYHQLSHAIFDSSINETENIDGGFHDADSDCEQPLVASILGRIIRITDNVIAYRERIELRYGERDYGFDGDVTLNGQQPNPRPMIHGVSRPHGCYHCTASEACDCRSVDSRDSAASSMGGDSDIESEIAAVTVSLRKPTTLTMPRPEAAPVCDRPGSAPPVGNHRLAVSTRDACVQMDSADPNGQPPTMRCASSQMSEPYSVDDETSSHLEVGPVPSAVSTRSLDGFDRVGHPSYRAVLESPRKERMNGGQVQRPLSNASSVPHHPNGIRRSNQNLSQQPVVVQDFPQRRGSASMYGPHPHERSAGDGNYRNGHPHPPAYHQKRSRAANGKVYNNQNKDGSYPQWDNYGSQGDRSGYGASHTYRSHARR